MLFLTEQWVKSPCCCCGIVNVPRIVSFSVPLRTLLNLRAAGRPVSMMPTLIDRHSHDEEGLKPMNKIGALPNETSESLTLAGCLLTSGCSCRESIFGRAKQAFQSQQQHRSGTIRQMRKSCLVRPGSAERVTPPAALFLGKELTRSFQLRPGPDDTRTCPVP